MTGFGHELKVTVGGEVVWGPDPAQVSAAAEVLRPWIAGDGDRWEAARAVLVWAHEQKERR